jgi:hypothetical protein
MAPVEQLMSHFRELDDQQQRLCLTALTALVNPDLDPKCRSAIPGMVERLKQHAEALGCAEYDEDGVPVDDAGNPVLPPSEEDRLALINMVLAAHPEKYARYPDGRWGPIAEA